MTISKCKLIDLPTYSDQRGALTCIEGALDIPFEIKRVYYLYGSDCRQKRGMHAHKRLRQLLVPVCGFFDITVDDGIKKKCFKMDELNTDHLKLFFGYRELLRQNQKPYLIFLDLRIYYSF